MPQLFLCLLLCLVIPNSTARAAEAILPVKVQIISMEKWQAMQESELQMQTANSDANYDYGDAFHTDELNESQTEEQTYDLSGATSMTSLLFARLDINSDGAITMTEYLARSGRRASEDNFHHLDRDADGFLSISELDGFYSL